MAVSAGRVVVTTGATFVTAVPAGAATIILINEDASSSITFGDSSGVTATKGAVLPPRTSITIPKYANSGGESLYGIVGSGSAALSFVVTFPG